MRRGTAGWRIVELGLLAWLGSAATALAGTFAIQPGDPNLVQFESHAPLETFSGKTRQMRGQVTLEPAHLADSISVHVEVDLASLDTGIGIRNDHMREEHLETDKYPKAVFTGGKVLDPSQRSLAPDHKVTFQIAGELDLHGVRRPLQADLEIDYSTPGGRPQLHVVGRFQVKLSDFEIRRPRFLMLRLDEVQRLTVDVVARADQAPAP